MLHTPSDMFCGGPASLPDGKLLIAGGTSRYEVLENEVTHAAGVIEIQNQNPDASPITLPAGSELTSSSSIAYRTVKPVTIDPATKRVNADGATEVIASTTETWIEALEKGKRPVVSSTTHFSIAGLHGEQARNVFGITNSITLEKQNFWGTKKSY